MRRFVLLSLVIAAGGCAFTPSGQSSGDDDGVQVDGATVIDAVPQSIDAPACADTDGDGLCNAVDPWPCGTTAPTISNVVMTGNDVWGAISNVSIGGAGNTAIAQPGMQLSYSITWSLRDSDFLCMNCRDQIEVGIVAGSRQRCVYDNDPPQNQMQSGTATIMMTAPTTPGVYSLRFQLARDFSCDAFGRTGWWIGEPSADKTFGVICVP